MTQKKPKWVLSYTLLGIACICFINPMPLLLDLIPDVIGYLVMIYAISKIANMVGEFDQVKDTLSKLALITALKIPAFFIMTAIWGGDITQRSIVAVFTLVISVVECCFLIPLIHELFVAFGADASAPKNNGYAHAYAQRGYRSVFRTCRTGV